MKNLFNYSSFRLLYFLGFWLLTLSYFSCTENRISCLGDEDCPPGQFCEGSYCIDYCVDLNCPEGWVCYAGSCFPDCDEESEFYNHEICDPPFYICNCEEDESCLMGRCFKIDFSDPCLTVNCGPGEICSNGHCVPEELYSDRLNPEKCYPLKCPPDKICLNGKCVPIDKIGYPTCEGVICNEDQVCLRGICVDFFQGNFLMEVIALDVLGNPVPEISAYIQNKWTVHKLTDEGKFIILVNPNEIIPLRILGHKTIEIMANPDISLISIQFSLNIAS
jgi:hypothetical protein